MKSENVSSSQTISHDILVSIESMGGVFTPEEAALKLDTTVENVNKEIKEGKLIAFEKDGVLRIPSFQIKGFKKMENLEVILSNMKDKTFESKMEFLISPQKSLSDRTPFYILKKKTSKKEIEKVIELSR